MNRLLPVLVAVFGLVLAGCSDADWDNAMSFLPMEHGVQAEQPAVPPAGNLSIAAAPETPAASMPVQSSNVQAADMAAVPPSEATAQHCRAVAAQRSADGIYMGMDEDAQKQEYDLSYADCMTWEAASGR
jgi:hypothetical protein